MGAKQLPVVLHSATFCLFQCALHLPPSVFPSDFVQSLLNDLIWLTDSCFAILCHVRILPYLFPLPLVLLCYTG